MDRITHYLDTREDHTDKPKKDKKWTIGGLFRRRKKEESDNSSSQEDIVPKKGFLSRRKSKTDTKRKRASKIVGTFDHIVVNPITKPNNTYNREKSKEHNEDCGILSDPSAGFVGYVGRGLLLLEPPSNLSSSVDKLPRSSRESLSQKGSCGGSDSLESMHRKGRRDRVKARVEAIRAMKNESSSEEESQKSNASSLSRFRSDDSTGYRESSLPRKTRAARTERYLKRMSRDEEGFAALEAQSKQPNTEAEQTYGRWTTSVFRSSPDNIKNYTTHNSPRSPVFNENAQKPRLTQASSVPLQTSASLTSISSLVPSHKRQTPTNPTQPTKPPMSSSSFNHNSITHRTGEQQPTDLYANIYPNKRSISYENSINRSLASTPKYNEMDVLHVQIPIVKPQAISRSLNSNQGYFRCPPPPPPRDPQRKCITPSYYENSRPISYAFENDAFSHEQNNNSTTTKHGSYINNQVNRSTTLGQGNIWSNNRCSSDDHIALSQSYLPPSPCNIPARPSSVTAEAMRPQVKRFITRHPDLQKPEPRSLSQFKYFADQNPRSRKPILIANANNNDLHLSDSQVVTKSFAPPNRDHVPVKTASNFWKQKDQEESLRKNVVNTKKIGGRSNGSNGTCISNDLAPNAIKPSLCLTVRNTESVSSPSSRSSFSSPLLALKSDIEEQKQTTTKDTNITYIPKSLVIKREPPEPPMRRYSRHSSGSSADAMDWAESNENKSDKRKSSNLEDALNELEAIYKSLKLGDEDLLDRAERRDVPTPASGNASYTKLNSGTKSDSGLNFERNILDLNKSPLRRQRWFGRSVVPDKVTDDMAYRRLHPKDRSKTLDGQHIAQLSYLQKHATTDLDLNDEEENSREPDIALDDVVYRNIRHVNNTLKVLDPQPPFGIPLGPISPAANSDYLHATPELNTRPRLLPQKSPDIVKDDLAYRSLRKDHTKDSTLPPNIQEDVNIFFNNNNLVDSYNTIDDSFKKKRAVRSLSANIYNLIQKETNTKCTNDEELDFEKAQSLLDVSVPDPVPKPIPARRSSYQAYGPKGDTEVPKTANTSTSPTSTETLTDSRNNLQDLRKNSFQQRLKVFNPSEDSSTQRPPQYTKPHAKVVTSKQMAAPSFLKNQDNGGKKSEAMETFLSAMSRQARETSEKIDAELNELHKRSRTPVKTRLTSGENTVSKNKTPSNEDSKVKSMSPRGVMLYNKLISQKIDDSKSVHDNSIGTTLSDNNRVSDQNILCKKLLECVVDSRQLPVEPIPETIELTAAIDSDQTTEQSEIDEMESVNTEPMVFTSVASLMFNKSLESMMDLNKEEKKITELKNKCLLQLGELQNLTVEHDYDNVVSGSNNSLSIDKLYHMKENEISPNQLNAPIGSEMKHKKSLNNQYQQNNNELHIRENSFRDFINTLPDMNVEITEVSDDDPKDLLTINDQPDTRSLTKRITKTKKRAGDDSPEYNSSEELAMIFDNAEKYVESTSYPDSKEGDTVDVNMNFPDKNQNVTEPPAKCCVSGNPKKIYEDDNEMNKFKGHTEYKPDTKDDITKDDDEDAEDKKRCLPKVATPGPSGGIRIRDKEGITTPWYRDPVHIILACSYCFAYWHQLVGLDLLTLLGLLLAMISVIAMLLI